MQALTARVRLAAYGFAPLAPLVWMASHLARAPEGYSRAPSGFFVFRIGKYALLIIVAIFVVEACSALIFDYLLAVRRKTEAPQILRSLSQSMIYVSLFFVFLPPPPLSGRRNPLALYSGDERSLCVSCSARTLDDVPGILRALHRKILDR